MNNCIMFKDKENWVKWLVKEDIGSISYLDWYTKINFWCPSTLFENIENIANRLV